jgi:hypothetical protein
MAKRVIPVQFVDLATGQLTMEAIRYLNDLDNGAEGSVSAIGKTLAGVNQTTQAIVNGTQPLADVIITGRGGVTSQIDAISANVTAVSGAASAGSLTASVSPLSAYGASLTAGPVTTNSVTVTPAGGTGPYTYSWAKESGDDFTVNTPTGATTTFTTQTDVSDTNLSESAIYGCLVTDSLSATFVVEVNVYAGFTGIF